MSITSALPLPPPPHTLSTTHHRHSSTPPPPASHLSLPISPRHSLDEARLSNHKAPTIRTRLSQLCREGQPEVALRVFDTLPQPTTVLWNTIIIGFVCNNMPHEALAFYARMRSTASTKCDSYTYSSTLKACADTRQLKLGKAVHCHVLRSGIYASAIVYNSLLNMYSSCLPVSSVNSEFRGLDFVRRVFDTMKKRNVVAWNVIISWYGKTERFYEAVAHFRRMMKMGIKPTAVSFINVFPAVSGLLDFKAAKIFYGLLVKFGDEYVGDLFVVSSVISMFSAVGGVELARKAFDLCLGKNAEVWNTMIGGYAKNFCYFEALELFVEALELENTLIDDLTLVAAITVVSHLQNLDIGKQLHSYIIKTSMVSSITVLNAVVVMYSRCNSIGESFQVFLEMQERDVVSWNSIITALVQNGSDEEGLMLVNEMQKQGFSVDPVTATALLSAASNLRSELIGKQTHAYLIRNNIQFDGMCSYLIDVYAKSGLIEKAQRIFEQTSSDHRDLAIWNAMISGNVQNGLTEEAIFLFTQMLKENIMPNAVTITSVLPACSQVGRIKQLHGFSIRHSLDQSVFVGSALVDMYSKSGTILYAENVFSSIPVKNHVAYTNMILGYGQHGMGAAALSLFNTMQFSGVTPGPITLVAALSACSYTGLVDEGLAIFYSMEIKYGLKPLAEHYCCMVDMLGRVGRFTEAFQFAEELGGEGYAIRAWGSLFAACKFHGRYDLAKIVAEKLLDLKVRDSMSGYFVLLSNIYADEGNWEYVDRLRKKMQERGLKKGAGCSWIEVAGCVNIFVSRDQKHKKCEDIYEMLATLAVDMKDAGYDHHDLQRDQVPHFVE